MALAERYVRIPVWLLILLCLCALAVVVVVGGLIWETWKRPEPETTNAPANQKKPCFRDFGGVNYYSRDGYMVEIAPFCLLVICN